MLYVFYEKQAPANSTDRIWLNLVKEILFSKEYEESIDFLNEKENHSCKCVLENDLSNRSIFQVTSNRRIVSLTRSLLWVLMENWRNSSQKRVWSTLKVYNSPCLSNSNNQKFNFNASVAKYRLFTGRKTRLEDF